MLWTWLTLQIILPYEDSEINFRIELRDWNEFKNYKLECLDSFLALSSLGHLRRTHSCGVNENSPFRLACLNTLVPSWWCCLERFCNHWKIESWWRTLLGCALWFYNLTLLILSLGSYVWMKCDQCVFWWLGMLRTPAARPSLLGGQCPLWNCKPE